jgi:hypothetical protein
MEMPNRHVHKDVAEYNLSSEPNVELDGSPWDHGSLDKVIQQSTNSEPVHRMDIDL